MRFVLVAINRALKICLSYWQVLADLAASSSLNGASERLYN